MRPLRLVATAALAIVIALAVAACSSGTNAGWTYVPTPAASTSAGASAGASGSGGASASAASSGSGASGAPSGSAAASGSAGASGSAAGGGTTLALTAQAIKFDKSTLDAPANAAFTINFTNNDNGVPHDVVIQDSSGKALFSGEQFSGPATKAYSVPALPAGTYTFICSIHPTLMTGTLNVK